MLANNHHHVLRRLIRAPLYPQLKDHPAVTAYPHVKGMTKDLFFWDHDVKEGGTDQGKSRFNEHEVQACVGLARWADGLCTLSVLM